MIASWPIPAPPVYRVDWPRIIEQFPELTQLADVAQSPRFHTEGDLLTHIRLTCEMLAISPAWRALSERHRAIVFVAGLLHDFGKLDSSPLAQSAGSRLHSRKGAVAARRLLYQRRVPFRIREAIVNLIRYHQVPFWVLEQQNPAALVQRISLNIRCDWLTTLAWADAKGRKSTERTALLDGVDLFTEMALSLDCFQTPAEFGSPHGRHLYFKGRWHNSDFAPPESFQCEAVFITGSANTAVEAIANAYYPLLPVISPPLETPFSSIRSLVSEHLVKGDSFVVHAAGLSLKQRRSLIDLATEWNANIELVYVETSPPSEVSELDVPDPWEADRVIYHVDTDDKRFT